jgi:hypothetical protein
VVLEKDGEINWSDCVRNEEVLHIVNEERNILDTVKPRFGRILRRKCLLEHLIEGKPEAKRRREEDLSSYWMTLGKREITGT